MTHLQVYQTFGVRHGDIVIGVIGHGRAASPAGLEPLAGLTGLDIEFSKPGKYRGMVPHVLQSRQPDISGIKGRFL